MGKIKKDIVIVWEDTIHSWNKFGKNAKVEKEESESLDIKIIGIWKKTSLNEFIKKVIEAISLSVEFTTNTSIIEDFITSVTLMNLLPFEIKLVWNDDNANKFLELIKYEKGEYFINIEELNPYHDDLKNIIKYFKDKDVLIEDKNKLVINGSVLNKLSLV